MFPSPLFAPRIAKHERHIDEYSNFLENAYATLNSNISVVGFVEGSIVGFADQPRGVLEERRFSAALRGAEVGL
jgi:hypothetical protein